MLKVLSAGHPIIGLDSFDSIFEEMEKSLFNDVNNRYLQLSKENVKFPKCNIYLNKYSNTVVCSFSLAGYKKEDINIKWNKKDQIITISNKEKEKEKEDNIKYYLKELKSSNFTRSFQFIKEHFNELQLNEKDVYFEDGILSIVFDVIKPEAEEPEELEIKIN